MDNTHYLWKGLDLEKYEVINILPKSNKYAVIIMRCRDPADRHWCLEYQGNGHYSSTYEELANYYRSRFKKELK